MEDAIRRFLSYLEHDCQSTNNTIVAYRTDLSQFNHFLRSRRNNPASVADIDSASLHDYRIWLEGRSYAPSTIARKLASTRSFIDYMGEQGVLECHEAMDILQAPSQPRPIPRILKESEIQALFVALEAGKSPRDLRDKAIVALLHSTGMRASDVVALRVSDLDLNHGTVLRPPERTFGVPLDASAAAIEDYLANGRPNLLRDSKEEACFLNQRGQALTRQGLWLVVKSWVETAGIRGEVSPHTFRHTAAHRWLQAGRPHQEVQEVLGLSSPNTLRIHLHTNGAHED
ncbi:MAG: tyrosine-type recombinase/integrase [Anaerolineales bacterium]|jgi:integrase/recombinase XerD